MAFESNGGYAVGNPQVALYIREAADLCVEDQHLRDLFLNFSPQSLPETNESRWVVCDSPANKLLLNCCGRLAKITAKKTFQDDVSHAQRVLRLLQFIAESLEGGCDALIDQGTPVILALV